MSDTMPEGLRKHFEAKERGGEPDKDQDDRPKMAHKEALRKAKKAQSKRSA
mgnify:CR=1 FL=1